MNGCMLKTNLQRHGWTQSFLWMTLSWRLNLLPFYHHVLASYGTDDAASPVVPYNQGAVIENRNVYSSGSIGLSASSGAMVGDSVEKKQVLALSSLNAILQEAGCCRKDIVKTVILLGDMK